MELSIWKHKGALIAFEAIDGAGKSTQVELLARYLRQIGFEVIVTSWGSSVHTSQTIRARKDKRNLTIYGYSLAHALDLEERIHTLIIPSLKEGKIIICDRHAYTALARDVVRGLNRDFVKQMYEFAVKPDLVLYFRIPVEAALERKKKEGIGFWEAFLDLGVTDNREEGFCFFQHRVAQEYEKMVEEFGFRVIDGNRSKNEVYQDVIRHVSGLLSFHQDIPRDTHKATFKNRQMEKQLVE